MKSCRIFQHCIGRSVEGREILLQANFDLHSGVRTSNITFLIGGMHGDEPATVVLLKNFTDRYLAKHGVETPVVVLPVANPDGCERGTRWNARNVDINRNCDFNWHVASDEPPGPEPWSEPETRALRDFILALEPVKIVSLHWALAEIDADGPQSTLLAQRMWDALDANQRLPYRLRFYELGHGKRRLDHTYEVCPGSLGQWCGYGLRYANGLAPAMVTLELPYDPKATSRPSPLPEGRLEALRELWKLDSASYIAAVEPGVNSMLLAACAFL